MRPSRAQGRALLWLWNWESRDWPCKWDLQPGAKLGNVLERRGRTHQLCVSQHESIILSLGVRQGAPTDLKEKVLEIHGHVWVRGAERRHSVGRCWD